MHYIYRIIERKGAPPVHVRPLFLGACTTHLFSGLVESQALRSFAECHGVGGHSVVDEIICPTHRDCHQIKIAEANVTSKWRLQGISTWNGTAVAIFRESTPQREGNVERFIALVKSLQHGWRLIEQAAVLKYDMQHVRFSKEALDAYANTSRMRDEVHTALGV